MKAFLRPERARDRQERERDRQERERDRQERERDRQERERDRQERERDRQERERDRQERERDRHERERDCTVPTISLINIKTFLVRCALYYRYFAQFADTLREARIPVTYFALEFFYFLSISSLLQSAPDKIGTVPGTI
jgi:hypothetical protein